MAQLTELPIPEIRGSNPVIGKMNKISTVNCWKDENTEKVAEMS